MPELSELITTVIIPIIVPVATLITAIVAAITIHYLKKQSKFTEDALNASKKASEINAFLSLQKDFTLDQMMVEVRRAISTGKPVLKNEGGPIDQNDFDSYIEFVNRFLYYSNVEVIDEKNIIAAFGAPMIEISENPHVMKHILDQQKKYGELVLAGITDLIEKTKKARPKLTENLEEESTKHS